MPSSTPSRACCAVPGSGMPGWAPSPACWPIPPPAASGWPGAGSRRPPSGAAAPPAPDRRAPRGPPGPPGPPGGPALELFRRESWDAIAAQLGTDPGTAVTADRPGLADQLRRAVRLGIAVPRTVVTDDPAQAL